MEPEQKEKLKIKVVGLLRYTSFADMMQDFPAEYFGATSIEGSISSMRKYYSEEDENKFGVLGIRIRLAD